MIVPGSLSVREPCTEWVDGPGAVVGPAVRCVVLVSRSEPAAVLRQRSFDFEASCSRRDPSR